MLSDLYTDITNKLGITEQYSIIAASFGGYIALSHAIFESGRVDKIVLLGPMGITPATSSVNTKLILYSLFPFKMFQENMRQWALGDDPFVRRECDEWFEYVLNGVNRKGAPPLTFTPGQLQKVQSPVLLVLGTKDQLVGNPEEVKPLANNVPDIKIKVLDSAHLIGMEKTTEVNVLINHFLTHF
jgi:pimeloyl-ACP methyl ester carboxylesterase